MLLYNKNLVNMRALKKERQRLKAKEKELFNLHFGSSSASSSTSSKSGKSSKSQLFDSLLSGNILNVAMQLGLMAADFFVDKKVIKTAGYTAKRVLVAFLKWEAAQLALKILYDQLKPKKK